MMISVPNPKASIFQSHASTSVCVAACVFVCKCVTVCVRATELPVACLRSVISYSSPAPKPLFLLPLLRARLGPCREKDGESNQSRRGGERSASARLQKELTQPLIPPPPQPSTPTPGGPVEGLNPPTPPTSASICFSPSLAERSRRPFGRLQPVSQHASRQAAGGSQILSLQGSVRGSLCSWISTPINAGNLPLRAQAAGRGRERLQTSPWKFCS